MRTRVFRRYAEFSQDLMDDLAVLWKLPSPQKKALLPHLLKIVRTHTSHEADELRAKAVDAVGGHAADILRALKVLEFFYVEWDPTFDTADAFRRDIDELKLVPEKDKDNRRFVIEYAREIEKENKRRIQRAAANRQLPSFKAVSATIDMRAVIDQPFKLGGDISEYMPTCGAVVPVVVISVLRDSGDPTDFIFQCEADNLRLLIDYLTSALADLDAAKRYVTGRRVR